MRKTINGIISIFIITFMLAGTVAAGGSDCYAASADAEPVDISSDKYEIGAEMMDGDTVEALCAADMQQGLPYKITNIVFIDVDTLNVEYTAETGAPSNAVLYAVAYTDVDSGAVSEILSEKVSGSGTASLNFKAPPAGEVKAFIWEDSDAVKPLSNMMRTSNFAEYPEGSRTQLLAPESQTDTIIYDNSKDSLYYQSFADYRNGYLKCYDLVKKDAYYQRDFSGPSGSFNTALDILQSYIDMLCAEDSKFINVGESLYDDKKTGYYDHVYLLRYTGTQEASGNLDPFGKEISEKGDIAIQFISHSADASIRIRAAYPLEPVDVGFRYGDEKVYDQLEGPSIYSRLYQMPDGRYVTGDGRLSAAKGEALIFCGDEKIACDAAYSICLHDLRANQTYERLHINDFKNDDDLQFTFGINGLRTGDIYTIDNRIFKTGKELGTGKYIEKDCVSANINQNGKVKFSNTRVMYYNPNDVAVVYFYIDTGRTPEIIEGLAAVDLEVKPYIMVSIILDTPGGGLHCPLCKKGPTVFDWYNGTCAYCTDGYTEDGLECQICNGTGKCAACGGDGYYVDELPGYDPGGGSGGEDDPGGSGPRTCNFCDGSGGRTCLTCGGTGKLNGHDCPNFSCNNGRVACGYCGGDGILYN